MTPGNEPTPDLAPSLEAASSSTAVADWAMLLKPRIATFVALAAFVGGWLVTGSGADLWRLAEASLWITLTAGAAGIFNQVIERDTDALMHRTRNRPIPTGRVSIGAALGVAGVLAAAGTAGLALRFEPISAVLALATILAYALLYTPLKRVTTFNTVVGAVPGAMPPLLGYMAIAGDGGVWGWSLFGLLFVWQFPHFLAIAWLYRADYARADLKMLASVPGADGIAGRQALIHCLPILPIGLLPVLQGAAGPVFAFGALAAGLAYVAAAGAFARREDERNARRLLRISLLHLPLCLGFAVLDALVAV